MSRFKSNLVRNYKKAVTAGAVYKTGVPLDDVLQLASSQLKEYTRMKPDDLERFASLCESLMRDGMAESIGVYQEDRLMASCILFIYQKRVYYILAGNHPDSKTSGASHFLLYEFIERNAGKDLVLDFVGSDFTSIAFFYECFGASPEHYYSLRYNHLPALIKWIKR